MYVLTRAYMVERVTRIEPVEPTYLTCSLAVVSRFLANSRLAEALYRYR
jgi:hypothetical protein